MDLFTKRCGCGRILRLRESCPACAERKRAEMHAKGVATVEEQFTWPAGAQLFDARDGHRFVGMGFGLDPEIKRLLFSDHKPQPCAHEDQVVSSQGTRCWACDALLSP
jgi:hypothetical protein